MVRGKLSLKQSRPQWSQKYTTASKWGHKRCRILPPHENSIFPSFASSAGKNTSKYFFQCLQIFRIFIDNLGTPASVDTLVTTFREHAIEAKVSTCTYACFGRMKFQGTFSGHVLTSSSTKCYIQVVDWRYNEHNQERVWQEAGNDNADSPDFFPPRCPCQATDQLSCTDWASMSQEADEQKLSALFCLLF